MGVDKSIQSLLYRIGEEVALIAREKAPKLTHNLADDIKVYDGRIGQGEVRVGNSKLAGYAAYVHEGTGIYGYKKRRIYPKVKQALMTPWGPRRSIKGMKGRPYLDWAMGEYLKGGLERALDAGSAGIEKGVLEEIKKAVKGNIVFK